MQLLTPHFWWSSASEGRWSKPLPKQRLSRLKAPELKRSVHTLTLCFPKSQGTEEARGGMQKVIDKDLWDAPVEFMPPDRSVPTPGNE